MEEKAPGCRAGVDGISEALELDTLLVKLAYKVYEMLDAATEAVEFPDYKRVAIVQRFLCFE